MLARMARGGTAGAIALGGGARRLESAPSPSGRPRTRVVVGLAGVAAALGGVAALALLPGTTAGRAPAARREGLLSLPAAAQGPVSAAIGGDQPGYRVSGLRAVNPAQRLRVGFSRRGVAVASGGGRLSMALSAYGYASALRPVAPAAPHASANRVSYSHGALHEWFANGPLGLEQGFDVAARPSAGSGPLTFSLALSGNLDPRLEHGSLLLSGRGVALRYGGLVATDARGRALRSWLQLVKGHVLIRLDDRGAVYPLRVDPLIQQGEKLTGGEEIGKGFFGVSVALSSNGDTALIGGEDDDSGIGAAWVFTRSGSTWSQQAKLTGGEEVGKAYFGRNVALSADGNTALIGDETDDEELGAAWVFTRTGSTWTQQGKKLTGGEESGKARFGDSVALSSEGSTALIGGYDDNTEAGAAWVFTRSGSTWSQQGAKPTGKEESGKGFFGGSTALSSEGNTALVGGRTDGANAGAVWVFTRSGSTWTQQGKKLTGGEESGGGYFGQSVALSSEGNTALIGGEFDGDDIGAAWVFTRSGSTWTQQGAKLTGSGESGKGLFGDSVALSSEGNTALIGGAGADGESIGAAWLFTRSGSTWTQEGEKLTGSGESGEGAFGGSVALSSEGSTALIGGFLDDDFTGAAWVFGNPVPTPTQTSTPTTTTTTPSTPTSPVVTSVSQSNRRWREGNALAQISAKRKKKKKPPVGTTFSFVLNVPASVTFRFTEPAGGRRVGKKCVAQTRKNRHKRRCTRTVVAGTLTFSGVAGTNKVRFEGRIAKHKKLKPGSYTLLVTATASGKQAATRTLHFKIAA